jgi:hypothetical protein
MGLSTSTHSTAHTLASADSSSQLLNEIMPMIYKRFTEKASEEWRQIYKVCTQLPPLFDFTDIPGSATARVPDQEWLRAGH